MFGMYQQFNHVGFEGHLVSYDTYQTLDQSKAKLISIGNEIEKIREIKTPALRVSLFL
jgi:Xaa-Pro aminopeptidase